MVPVNSVAMAVSIGLAAVAAAGYVAYKSGLFARLIVEERSFGPWVLLYHNKVGTYSDISKHREELACSIIEDARLVHVYDKLEMDSVCFLYDDPKRTQPEQCRASVCYPQHTGQKGFEASVASMASLSVVKTGELKVWYASMTCHVLIVHGIPDNRMGHERPLTTLSAVGCFPEARCLAVKCPIQNGRMSLMVATWRAYSLLAMEAIQRLGKPQADEAMVSGFLEFYRPAEEVLWLVLPLNRDAMLSFSGSVH